MCVDLQSLNVLQLLLICGHIFQRDALVLLGRACCEQFTTEDAWCKHRGTPGAMIGSSLESAAEPGPQPAEHLWPPPTCRHPTFDHLQ